MAKNSVQDWDVDAEQNEDVGGVDIRQTAPGANIGPGIREVMAQIKEFIVGATFTGTTTVGALYVSSSTPAIRLIETDAGTNEKIFRIVGVAGDVFFQSMTDAGAGGVNALIFRRGTGTAWESIDVNVPFLLNTTELGLSFQGDTDTGIGQLVANTVSIFAANAAVPRVTISSSAVNLELPTNIDGNTIIDGDVTASGTITSSEEFVAAAGTAANPGYNFTGNRDTGIYSQAADKLGFSTNGVHRGSFDDDGRFLIGPSTYTGLVISDIGCSIQGAGATAPGAISTTVAASAGLFINRQTNDGNLVEFYQGGTFEGAISVSGTTVSYGSFSGYHWSQLADGSQPDILRGTIVETIDAMCDWPGEDNEQLPKFKISDTAASASVYGVFMNWDEHGDACIVSLGAFLIRIASGQTVARGDLIESAGTGCGRVQADGIVRASTIGKVTSPTVVTTYDDGSFLVPCTLCCG